MVDAVERHGEAVQGVGAKVSGDDGIPVVLTPCQKDLVTTRLYVIGFVDFHLAVSLRIPLI